MFDKKKRVYRFGGKTAEGDGHMRELLGGKGANLAEMSRLGMPVPAGFTITTECCAEYYSLGGGYTDDLKKEVAEAMRATETIMGKKFGDPSDPLLVSCRSGARSSMPGMMDTILNIGLCSATLPGMIQKTGNPRFVYDAYRRLIMMYSDVVMEKAEGIEPADGQGIRQQLDRMMMDLKDQKGYKSDTEITAEELKDLCEKFKVKVKEVLGVDFPDRMERGPSPTAGSRRFLMIGAPLSTSSPWYSEIWVTPPPPEWLFPVTPPMETTSSTVSG